MCPWAMHRQPGHGHHFVPPACGLGQNGGCQINCFILLPLRGLHSTAEATYFGLRGLQKLSEEEVLGLMEWESGLRLERPSGERPVGTQGMESGV